MIKARILIPYVSWREGRPRFNPGPAQRRLGFVSQDLRHGPEGPWYSIAETEAFMQPVVADILKCRAAKAAGKRLRPRAKAPALTIGDLLTAWYAQHKAAPSSMETYRKRAFLLRSQPIASLPVAAVKTADCHTVYRELVAERGLHTARGAIAVLSNAFAYGLRQGVEGIAYNPCLRLGMAAPAPRVRALSIAEVNQWVEACDLIGRPEIGDSIMLGAYTGQRQGDRLALLDRGRDDAGRLVFEQAKTRAIVAIPPAPALTIRLEAAKARHALAGIKGGHVVLDEQNGRPFDRGWYGMLIRETRAAAHAGIPADFGGWLLRPMPGLNDKDTGLPRDQDLRDTAVTWLARAGCTVPEICAISGHSEASVYQILKHYLAPHPELADNAIAKLARWQEKQAHEDDSKLHPGTERLIEQAREVLKGLDESIYDTKNNLRLLIDRYNQQTPGWIGRELHNGDLMARLSNLEWERDKASEALGDLVAFGQVVIVIEPGEAMHLIKDFLKGPNDDSD